jgi:hypothetical protein
VKTQHKTAQLPSVMCAESVQEEDDRIRPVGTS